MFNDGLILGDPLADPKVDLNEYTILGLLGAFLKANPENRAYDMAPFRALQCVNKLSNLNGIFSGQGQKDHDCNMMESVGCLYVLCMWLASVPTIENSEALFSSANVVFAALAESVVVMMAANEKGPGHKFELLHPRVLLSQFDKPNLAQTLRDSLKVARNIVRDVTRCIREGREPPNAKKAKARGKPPTDCWEPHTIFFMCSMAATHLCGVLKDLGSSTVVPGAMESVVLAASLVPAASEHNNSRGLAKGGGAYLRALNEEESRFDSCLSLSLKLGRCIVVYAFDERSMQELRIARSHLTKKIAHPDAEYARVRCAEFRSEFLGLAASSAATKASSASSLSASSAGFPAEGCLVTGSLLPSWTSRNPYSSSLDLTQPPGQSSGQGQGQVHALSYAEERECKYFWQALQKTLRPAFLVTRLLRLRVNGRANYRSDYKPTASSSPKSYDFYVNKMSDKLLTVAAAEVEALMFFSDAAATCAPQNNPARSVFWACLSIIEWLSQETSAGRGFHQSVAAMTSNLQKELKGASSASTKAARPRRPVKLGPIVSPSAPAPAAHATHAKSNSKGSGLSLMEKLAQAAKTARIEAQIDTLSRDARSSGPKIDRLRVQTLDATLKKGMLTLRKISEQRKRRMDKERLRGQSAVSELFDDEEEEEEEDEAEEEEEEDEGEGEWDGEEEHEHEHNEGEEENEDKEDIVYSDTDSASRSTASRRTAPAAKAAAPGDKSSDEAIDPLTALLGSPLVGDINKFRRGLKLAGILAAEGGKNLAAGSQRRPVSSVWERAVEEDASDKLMASLKKQFRNNAASFEAQSKKIAEDVLRFQKEREEEEADARRALEDSQEMEVSKSRAHKIAALKNARDAARQAQIEGNAMKKKLAEDADSLTKRELAARKALLKQREQENAMEVARLEQIKALEEGAAIVDERERRDRKFAESMRLKGMADAKEWNEIVRRAQEEGRMRYLEERRRAVEKKQWYKEHGAAQELELRRKEFLEQRKKMQARLRIGNFRRNPGGRLGFYDDMRAKPVEWIQYEDASGTPYFWDPVYNQTTYEMPSDAPVRHYTVDERIAYDAEHGEGAYDREKFDARNRESINQYGGYQDENGEWITVNGFYGEDGTFFDMDVGFFDEWGIYRIRQVITENLSFMV